VYYLAVNVVNRKSLNLYTRYLYVVWIVIAKTIIINTNYSE